MASIFVEWLFIGAPRKYLTFLRDLTIALYNYFSISFHFTTLFAPWRHDVVDLSHIPPQMWVQAIVSNTVSRFIGFILRSMVILLGLVGIVIVNSAAVLFFLGWYLLPLLLFYSIFFGAGLLTRGI